MHYRGTQMQYALKYLAVHRHTRLVTINIGANDVFLCQETTADACASAAEVQAVLQEIQANLTTIYTKIRDVAHYHGLLVALTYYSISYSDPAQVAGTEALNSAIASVTEKFGGKVADGFAAFEGPSAAFGGSPCAAGLLTKHPDGTCTSTPACGPCCWPRPSRTLQEPAHRRNQHAGVCGGRRSASADTQGLRAMAL